MSEKEFMAYVDAEITAYFVNTEIIEKKLDHEFVDCIANSYSNIDFDSDYCVETFIKTHNILKNDYGVDMMELPFAHEDLKEEIRAHIEDLDIKI